jgi:GntR family transcriptional regulator
VRLDVKLPTETELAPGAVDRSSPLPLYAQIARRLVAELSRSAAETRFYGDEEVAARFDVSRMTARQAIQQLVDECFLRRVKGIGTFVAAGKIEERSLASFFDGSAIGGRPMTARVLTMGTEPRADVPPDPALGAAVTYIERLRFVGVVPIVLDHRYLPRRLARKLKRADAERHSLLDWLKQSVTLDRVEMQVEAIGADADSARHLRILPGEPALVRHLRYVAKDGAVVMAGRSVYRGDVVRYSFSVPL